MRPLHTRPITGPTSMSKQDLCFFYSKPFTERKTLTKERFQRAWPIKQRDKQAQSTKAAFLCRAPLKDREVAEPRRAAPLAPCTLIDSTPMHSHVLITWCIQLFRPSIKVIASIIQIMRYGANASSKSGRNCDWHRLKCASDSERWSNLSQDWQPQIENHLVI